ncbi:hypothetical protein BJ508DRAFT_328107 [Ascobolus immersus RN42]|uniref:Uncharacterized protein n=1 Tax=Ascobolus immersus RN42 TaxID=1160509 RepID=A0A3N4I2Q1_ASCIM|nr:hypothetical protein BJ508DRAFT_328107 [Ascobolus immersus RN42]
MPLIKKVNDLINNGRAYVARRNTYSESTAGSVHEEELSSHAKIEDDSSSTSSGTRGASLSGSWDDCDFTGKRRPDDIDNGNPTRPVKKAKGKEDLVGPPKSCKECKGKGRQNEPCSRPPRSLIPIPVTADSIFEPDRYWEDNSTDEETDHTSPAPRSRAPYFALMRQAEELGVSLTADNPLYEKICGSGSKKPCPNLSSSSQPGPSATKPKETDHGRLVEPSPTRHNMPIPSLGKMPIHQVPSIASSWEQHHIESQLFKAQSTELVSRPPLRRSPSSYSIILKESWEKLPSRPKSPSVIDNSNCDSLSNSWASLEPPAVAGTRPGTPWEFLERVRRGKAAAVERNTVFEPCHLEAGLGSRCSSDVDLVGGGVGRSR